MSEVVSELPSKELVEFLELVPPGQIVSISNLASSGLRGGYNSQYEVSYINTPDIQMHCANSTCNGLRFFRATVNSTNSPTLNSHSSQLLFLTYKCSNCMEHEKVFSIVATMQGAKSSAGSAMKIGELPSFGAPTSDKLLKLVGSDREIFLKGRKCENQGLGIAAFAYYRRVVENQKNRILNEVSRVAEKIGAERNVIDQILLAKQENQFTKALMLVKSTLPQSLLINGQNPLLLLHAALSEGLHGHTDEECLELAMSVRIVLSELAERLANALKDDQEVVKALQVLMNKKAQK